MTGRRPDAGQPPGLNEGAVELLAVIRRHGALTRSQMNEVTGWARVTVTSRLEELLEAELLTSTGPQANGRGRPAVGYTLNDSRAALMVADIGALGMRVARTDLAGTIERTRDVSVDVRSGPDPVLRRLRTAIRRLSQDIGDRPVWGIALSVPGPVEFRTGRTVSPPIMTGWDQVPIRERVGAWLPGAPVLVDNDVNAMALGELRYGPQPVADLLVVKVGTGVGAGLISEGHVVRGGAGAAGDIGHTWAESAAQDRRAPECHCGKLGCVEAIAGGWALARDLAQLRDQPCTVADVVSAIAAGDADAVRLVRRAGRELGASLAVAVSLLNPSAVVLTGQVADAAEEHLLSGIRERVHARALPLATRELPIVLSTLGRDAGVMGLAHELSDLVLGATE